VAAPLLLDAIDRRLLDAWQRDFPLDPRPFAQVADVLGIEEAEAIERLRALQESGVISRIGATVRPNTAGRSTLVAASVPEERLDAVGAAIGALPGVNHCYEREHPTLNLWFVVTAADSAGLAATLAAAEALTGTPLIDLPLEAEYRIDLGFPLQWRG
jgi:DNA-binding Lrp family transcriptional regulator